MNLLSLDLEMEQPSGNIIQIGYVIGDPLTGEIVHRRSILVRQEEPLSEFIQALTGLTDEDNKMEGISLEGAYRWLQNDLALYPCFINPLTWGGGDTTALREQLEMGEDRFIFGRRWIDVKTVFIAQQMAKGLPFVGGLRKSMNRVGCRFEGRAHDALVDAENTFRMYSYLLKEMKNG